MMEERDRADVALRQALAILSQRVPREHLIRLAEEVERLARMRAHGGVDVRLNCADGVFGGSSVQPRFNLRGAE